jgi:hypothetical protein
VNWIIKRGEIEVNFMMSNNRTGKVIVIIALVLVLSGCNLSERRASRIYEEAGERFAAGELEQGVKLLEEILESYPETEVAAMAGKDIGLYRGVAGAVRKYPREKARELMIMTARVLERFKERGKLPATLDKLVPGSLSRMPVDPWGNALVYTRAANRRGYTLTCLAADGAPAGAGAGRDLVIRNGQFLTGDSR